MRGFFGIGVYHPKREVNIGTLWRTANLMGASFLFTIKKRYKKQASDTMKSHRHIPLHHFDDFDDCKKHLPYRCRIVGVELTQEAENLKEFCHPEQACYLLGAEDYGLPEDILEQCHLIVKLNGFYSMNVAVAGSIVIYHRVAL